MTHAAGPAIPEMNLPINSQNGLQIKYIKPFFHFVYAHFRVIITYEVLLSEMIVDLTTEN